MKTTILTTLSLLAASTYAYGVANTSIAYRFPTPSWVENVAAMRNGSVLASLIGQAEVWMVTPRESTTYGHASSNMSWTANLAASWPSHNAVFGISELRPNVFAVAVGNYSNGKAIPSTFSIWSIDVCAEAPLVPKIADVPDVQGVNGLAVLNAHMMLLADSWAGQLVALDTTTNTTRVVLDDATTKVTNTSAPIPIGINGLKVHNGWVYYSNFIGALLVRARISASGEITSDPHILASSPQLAGCDDLSVLADGSVLLAEPVAESQGGDRVLHVRLDGNVTVVAEGGHVAGTTSVTLGQGLKDRGVAYLGTMGGFGSDGVSRMLGRVVRLEGY